MFLFMFNKFGLPVKNNTIKLISLYNYLGLFVWTDSVLCFKLLEKHAYYVCFVRFTNN